MGNELKDILSNSNKDIDNQQLMDYLSNQLSKAQQHEVEKQITDDAFVNDAVEGLQQIQHKKDINAYVEQLNNELHKQVAKNKKRKDKRKLKNNPLTYMAIILFLLLLVICVVLVLKQVKNKNTTPQNKTATVYKQPTDRGITFL